MKINDWENYVYEKYDAIKATKFEDLKNYVSDQRNYAHNFTPEEVTEGEISNEDYYAAYVFDESKIAKRKVITKYESCWKKLIVVLASKDKINISNYCINTAGGLNDEESIRFYRDINPMQDSERIR